MAETWTWVGEPDNIHIVQADNLDMRVCFMTSNGPTVQRANLISAAPDMAEAIKPFVEALEGIVGEMDALDEQSLWDTDASALIKVGDLRRARSAYLKATGERSMTSNGPTIQRANLIAAAPDLAEALKSILALEEKLFDELHSGYSDDGDYPNKSYELDSAIETARAALAKATGERS